MKLYYIFIAAWCCSWTAHGTTTNLYHFPRTNELAILSGLSASVAPLNLALTNLDRIVGPFPLEVTNRYTVEYERIAWSYPTPESAWANVTNFSFPISVNFGTQLPWPQYFAYTNKHFNNTGWIKGTRETEGQWSAYMYYLGNFLQFRSSTSSVYVSQDGSTSQIARVIVGSLGDYCPETMVFDWGPLPDKEFPGANTTTGLVARSDLNVYYKLKMKSFIGAGFGDADSDGVPDFMDGYDFHSAATNDDVSAHTFQLWNLHLPTYVDPSNTFVYIDYDGSDPMQIVGGPGTYAPASGTLRVWNLRGEEPRDGQAITLGGNYVKPGLYEAMELGFQSAEDVVPLYIEGIRPALDASITATFSTNGFTWTCLDGVGADVLSVDFIEASSTVADNSPQQFEGHQTDFGDPCDPDDPGQALAVFHKDVRDEDFVVQDFDVDLHAEVLPSTISDSDLSESWVKTSGPDSGAFNKTDTFDVKYQNPKEGGLYQFEFDLGLSGCAKSGANLLLPLGGPDVTAYYLSEAQRYDTWLSTMKARVNAQTTSDFAAGFIIISYFTKTVNHMNHKFGTYEAGSSPCKAHCDNTVTISGYVFGKDHIGNFLFSYLAARTGFTFGATQLGAKLAAALQGQVDLPDDQAAYEAGYAHGQNPSGDFQAILESKDIDAMQNETAKKGWPSTDTATGTTYPTWGATHGGLDNPD